MWNHFSDQDNMVCLKLSSFKLYILCILYPAIENTAIQNTEKPLYI